MLLMMMRRRPILSDRWPAIGAAVKPATCMPNMQPPIRIDEKPISRARKTGRKVSSVLWVMARKPPPADSMSSVRLPSNWRKSRSRWRGAAGSLVAAGLRLWNCMRPRLDQDDAGHHHARDDVEHHDVAPAQQRQHGADHQRRHRVPDIAAHAVDRHHQPAPLGKAPRQQRNGGRVPEVVADADQGGAAEQHPVLMAEPHQQIGGADPEQGERHEQALAVDRIHQHAARHIGERARGRLAGQDRADLHDSSAPARCRSAAAAGRTSPGTSG